MAEETKPQEKPADEKPQGGAAPQEGAVVRDGPAWEKREALGLVNAVIETIKAVALKPAEAFAAMKREGGFQNPLIYAVIIGVIGGLGMALGGAIRVGVGQFFSGIIGAAIFAVIGPFIGAGIIHIMLKLLGAQKNGFEVTYRTVCYGMSPNIAGVVPVIGAVVGGVWTVVCIITGLTKTQECTTKTAAMAVLIPAAVVCCLCAGAAILMGGMIFAMLAGSAAAAQQTY